MQKFKDALLEEQQRLEEIIAKAKIETVLTYQREI